MHGFTCPGHFAEYSISDYHNVVKMPKDMDMVRAAPIFCAGVTGELVQNHTRWTKSALTHLKLTMLFVAANWSKGSGLPLLDVVDWDISVRFVSSHE